MEEQKLMQKGYRFVNPVENYAKSANITMRKEYFIDIKKPLKEIQESFPHLKSKGGIPFFYSDNTAYVDASDAHSLVIGSTGSKKTRLVVMPSVKLLAYADESMIIADPKAEVYERTACELKKDGYQIFVINFRHPIEGNCWNPLEIPFRFFKEGKFDRAREHANDVAINLALSEVAQKDPFWDRSAYNLLFGLIQLSFIIGEKSNSVSMNDVLQLRAAIFPDGENVNKEYVEIAKTDQIVYHSLLGTINAPERTRNSILSMFDQKVSCFSYQEDLKEMMDSNSIDLNNIGNKKTAIFLILPDEKTTYHQLVSLFIKQSYEYLIYLAQQLEERSFPVRINYVLDEFSNLPAIKDFPAMISAARSRNIRFSLIVQSFQQLVSKYKSDADTIKGNCTNLIFLNSRELNVLEEVSVLCGVQENNKRLFTVFGLQHLDKEKGQAVILSGRLFPFITELMDIDRFDNGIYEHLPIEKRLQEDKKKKSVIFNFEEKIKKIEQKESDLEQKESDLEQKESDLKQKESDLKQKEENLKKKESDLKQKESEEKDRKSNRKIEFRTCLCQYGSCFFILIAIMLVMCSKTLPKEHWVNISVIPIGVSLSGIVLLYLIGILSSQTDIAGIMLLGVPIVIEVLRIIFWKKNIYILDNAFYMLLCYYIAIALPYIDYNKVGWKLRKNYLILVIFLNLLLLPFLSYFSFSQKTWYSDINGIIIFGMIVSMIVFYSFRLAKNENRYKGEMEDIFVVCISIEAVLYFLLTFTEFIILLVHYINIF